MNLTIQITRYVDDHQPGWVECELVDADGRRHGFVDKVPVLSLEELDAASIYPRQGAIRCEALARWQDVKGRELVRVTTSKPDGIESVEGLSEFVVIASQVSPTPPMTVGPRK